MARIPHGTLAHFAINADDVARSRTFYERLFGWHFEPWGPPGFFRAETAGTERVVAAIQERRAIVRGTRATGFECTIAVDDLRATIALAVELGGRLVMDPFTIPGVVELAALEDPAGNVVTVGHYEDDA